MDHRLSKQQTKQHHMKHIVFDIETIPQDEAKLLALAPEFTAPGNLKDPAKIEAAVAKKRADYLADAALNWKTAEVVLIGAGDDTEIQSFTADSEKELVGNFLSLVADALGDGVAVGGHNVRGFDLPMLVNRARVLGLKVPANLISFWKGRPKWHDYIFDTLEILSFGKAFDGNGVDDVARVFGLPPKLGHGGDFPLLWRADRAAAIAYNRRDVEIEIEIARICGAI
jgi:predicted PolB exonuclease-like 3'-5' exonuclease